ncbi:hypothetical protein [Anderseniella sp. Alg231-50]|uniref:hypothetical protein n=1 Tax=Anderseniella sp. Alg231-50 TaxID=1922226 RepID=UPI000D562C7A
MQADDEKTLAGLLLALGVVLALYFPELSPFFAPYLLPSLFFVMVFSLLPFARIRADKLLHLHPIVVPLILWQQLLLPIGTIVVGRQIGLDTQIIFFIVLTLTSGSLFASPTLVQLMGLDQRIAVQTVVLSTLAAPGFIYLFFSILHTGPVDLDLWKFGERLFWFLLVPVCIFVVARMVVGNWSEAKKDQVDRVGRWGSVLSLVVFCFALEDEVNMHIAANVQEVINYLFIGTVTAAGVAVLTRAVMSRFGPRAAATATVLASFRNVGLTFGLVGSIAGPEVAVYVGVCQIPMFCAPLFFDLFIGRSQKSDQPGDQHASSKPLPDPIPDSPDPTEKVRQSLQQLNSLVASLQQTISERERPAMIQNTAHSPESAGLAYDGNAALAVSAEAQSQAVSSPANPDQAPLSELQIRMEIRKRMVDARALLVRLETEMHETTAKIIGHPGRYLAVFAVLATVGLAAIWQGNRYFYPMLFNDEMLVEVAEAHTQGRNYGVFDLNINIRDLRDETIERMTGTPDLVVLGASHWQEAHVDLLPQYNFYNSHVHRDYYEDMMAVTEMWVRHDKLPKEMIITIRDNLFTPVSERTDFLWYPGIKYYRDFADRIGFKPHAWWETLPYQTWRELVSLPLLWSQGKHQLQSDVMPHATDARNFDGLDTLLPGGSILWSGEHQRIFTAQRARDEALNFAKARRNDPPKIDPKGLVHMEALFDFLKKQGVKVTLAHPQFNPVFWEAVQGSPYVDGLGRIEQITQDWAKKYGFAVIGGFSPDAVGCRADQYIDAEHGDPACLGALLAQYDVVNGRTSAEKTSRTSQLKKH